MGIAINYQYIYTVLNGNYVVLPASGTIAQIPPEANNDVGRYSTNFAGPEAKLPEDFCYYTLKREKEEPLLFFSKVQRKTNSTSVAKFAQCAGWKWEESLLRDHFDDILRFGFYSEAQVDRLAEGDKSVPDFGGGEAPGITDFMKIDIADNALRAVLFGVFSRWLLGKAQVKIAVPESEREHYAQYVLSAVREIYSYFPVCLRAEAGFASYVQKGKEQTYPRYSIVFVPESMADTRTLFLDGSSRIACEALSASTTRKNLDRFIEHLAGLRDPAERKRFLDTVYEELEKKETPKETAASSARQYAVYGEAMQLLENRGSFDEKAEQWLAFYNNRENYPKTMAKEIDELIKGELNEKDLLAFAEKRVPDGTGIEKQVEGLSALLPLAGKKKGCSGALLGLLDKRLMACGDENAETVFRALEKQEGWAATDAKNEYEAVLKDWGKKAGNNCLNKAAKEILTSKAPTLPGLQEQTKKIIEEAQSGAAPFLDKEQRSTFDDILIEQQEKVLKAAVEEKLQGISPVTGNNPDRIRARMLSLEGLKKEVQEMDDSFTAKQEKLGKLDLLIKEAEGSLDSASVKEQELTNKVLEQKNYFKMLSFLAEEEEKTDRADLGEEREKTGSENEKPYDRKTINIVQKKIVAKHPAGRNAYLSEYKKGMGEDLSPRSLGKSRHMMSKQIWNDLEKLPAEPLDLPSAKNRAELSDRIGELKDLFGGNIEFKIGKYKYKYRQVKNVLGFEYDECSDEQKRPLIELCKELIAAEYFNEDDFERLAAMFVSSGLKRISLLLAVQEDRMSNLSPQQCSDYLADVYKDYEESKKEKEFAVDLVKKTILDSLDDEDKDAEKREIEALNPTQYAEEWETRAKKSDLPHEMVKAGKKRLAELSGRKKLPWWQIAVIAVLGALILAAGVFFAVRMLKPKPEPVPEEPVATPSPLEGRAVTDGFLDFGVPGVDEEELKTRLAEQFDVFGGTAQMPDSLYEDEALLKSLGYPVSVKLDGSGLRDLSVLSGAAGLRKLSLKDNRGITDVAALDGLTHLLQLDLRGTGVTEEKAKPFSEAHPGCWLVIGNPGAEQVVINGACYSKGETSWDLKNRGITDLSLLKEPQYSGIFSELQELDLSVNPLRSLAGAENLENLNVLSLQEVQGSYDMLNELNLIKNLRYLRVSRNNWSTSLLDTLTQNVAAEKGFVLAVDGDASQPEPAMVTIGEQSFPADAESLDLSGLGLTEESEDLQNLAYFTRLRVLDLSDNNIADASVVANVLPQLEWLDISGNGLTSVTPLAPLQKLHTLYVQENPIEKLDFRDGQFAALKELTIGYDGQIDLSYLIYMRALEFLDVRTVTEQSGLEDAVLQHNTLKIILRSDSLMLSEEFRAQLQEKGILLLPEMIEAERPQPTPEPTPEQPEETTTEDGEASEAEGGAPAEELTGNGENTDPAGAGTP